MKTDKLKNKIWKRCVSFFTALALLANAAPVSGPIGFLKVAEPLTVQAYTPDANPSDFTTNMGIVSITDASQFVDYCYYYRNNAGGFAQTHQNDTIQFSDIHEFGEDFGGLGNASYPFAGKLEFSGGAETELAMSHALFTYVYDTAQVKQYNNPNPILLKVTRNGETGTSLLAENVLHNPALDEEDTALTSAKWTVEMLSGNENSYGGIIGEMQAKAELTIDFTNNSAAEISADNAVGVICGALGENAKLTVNYTENASAVSVTSKNGNAGGIVGTMAAGSTLTLSNVPAGSRNVTASKGYAGGIVGDMVSTANLDLSSLGSNKLSVGGTIIGKNGAGGLYGHYVNNAAEDPDETEFDIAKYKITAAVSGDFCGGLFGVLENKSAQFTIYDSTFSAATASEIVSIGSSGTYGGLIGKYTTTSLNDTFILEDMNYSAAASASLTAFGGAIGKVDSAAYIKADDLVISGTGTSNGTFGGLIADTGSNGVFVDASNFKLTADGFTGGGIVGKFTKGVLRLSGTTDMAGAKTASVWNSDKKYGQLVGENGDVLVYSLGNGSTPAEGTTISYDSGWEFKRSSDSISDDLGTWGEVVRIADIEDETKGVLTKSGHSVTIKAAVTEMGTQTDLVRTALNIQLNNGTDYNGVLGFTEGGADSSTLLGTNLSISDDLSFSGTGITGFMRDGGDEKKIGTYTGTFSGNSHTITLAVGEKYGSGVTTANTNEGLGQIYRHAYNGLFSIYGGGTVQELTISGDMNVRNGGLGNFYVGGIAAKSTGDTTLDDITANQNVNYHEGASVSGSETNGKNIGGLIGISTGGNVSVTGTTALNTEFTLSGYHASWNVLGSLIGKVTSSSFEINIAQGDDDTLTDSHKTDISGITNPGTNADGGGLIGFITNSKTYTDRIVKIKNLTFDGAEVGNAASDTGGGLLGYSWQMCDVAIDGITVTDATIKNADAPNVGVMCYSATGRWTVNSLTVNKLTMTEGAETSLGMLVNEAYTISSNSVNNGLYLDVLNAGYKLTDKSGDTGITLPETLGVYDELAAYSTDKDVEDSVLKGGAGVISVNMNTDRTGTKTKITETGTYQNQLTSASSSALTSEKFANPNARYYYNLDVAEKITSKSNTGENLLLWSVKQYAKTNIQDNFTGAATGTADMTGLSFYPLYNGQNLSNLNVTFDYKGIYDTAENVFAKKSDNTDITDGYKRDPAEENQHKLMQSGLFINEPAGSTIELKNLTLSGNFLEVGKYSGAIISDTANGSVNIDGLSLNGLQAKTTEGADHNIGYLIINKITREDATKAEISVTLNDISTTSAYTNGIQVAKSLIGDVYGPNIAINLTEGIKLDARNSETALTGDDKTAMDTAYGTTRSIFTTATLFNSIQTTASANLIYNFTSDNDWGTEEIKDADGNVTGTYTKRQVTYGREIKHSVEWKDLEQKYHKEEIFTHPTVETVTKVYDFDDDWLPYVATGYNKDNIDSNNCYTRELKVNVAPSQNVEGCGTYDDPYIITNGTQLKQFADYIATGGGSLQMLNLPKENQKSNFNVVNFTKGNRWCDNEGTATHALFETTDGGSTFTYKETINNKTTTYQWNKEYLRAYLANAYYKIIPDEGNSITLPSDFGGFGAFDGSDNSGKYAFRGVIVGNGKNSDGSPKTTIYNNSKNPLVIISNGCVVKNLNVVQNADVDLEQTENACNKAYFSYKTGTNATIHYYGGIIGEVMGGDNIIDNCYVTQTADKKVTLKGDYALLCPVGSYVGAVVFGGVIFKNMTASTVNTNAGAFKVYLDGDSKTNLTLKTSTGAIYANPLIGRVINGYAVNETEDSFSVTEDGHYHDSDLTKRTGTKHSLQNTTKHYTIADINKYDTNKLNVESVPADTSTDGVIKIPDSQALFVLSLITQSTSGTATSATGVYSTSLSYGGSVKGMTHLATYERVGENTSDVKSGDFALAQKDTAGDTANTNYAIPYIIYNYTTANADGGYNARCVTSTLGYYDINLTGDSYVLPDSFRGLGAVGYYDDKQADKDKHPDRYGYSDRHTNRYCMKVNVFNGNNAVIDEDIYLNKYLYDNYFNRLHSNSSATQQNISSDTKYSINNERGMHGIGLFDTIVMRDSDSVIKDFDLSGSVNTAIFKNSYNDQEVFGQCNHNDGTYGWLVSGGVVGHSLKGTNVNFTGIALNSLKVRGNSCIGGLLGFSMNSSEEIFIMITECSANDISLEMPSAACETGNSNPRPAMGAFVGKIYEGGVKIYGTSKLEENDDTADYKEVKISHYSCNETDDCRLCAGGLVGYAGNGCYVYDMRISSKDKDKSITIGNGMVKMAGGIVGLIQPCQGGGQTAKGVFKNCQVKNINIKANLYAGGFYGGTTGSHSNQTSYPQYSTYQIKIQNCKMVGASNNNTIIGNQVAGGFVGDGYVVASGKDEDPNIIISDSVISNYKLTSGDISVNNNGYVGGFIGYCGAYNYGSVIASVYNSSVENCTLGDNDDYTGGVVGYIYQNNTNTSTKHKIAGYNVKLYNVTTDANNSNVGAWIGRANKGSSTITVQLSGIGIYGDGISKNVGYGNDLNNPSFVFADYTGKCLGTTTGEGDEKTTAYPTDVSTYNAIKKDADGNAVLDSDGNPVSNNVEMPKYPYVNIDPQSSMGSDEIISSDGAVLWSQTKSVVSGTHEFYVYDEGFLPVDTGVPNLDGKRFAISNNRSDTGGGEGYPKSRDYYIAPGKDTGTKTDNNQTLDIQEATPFLFTKVPETDNQYYLSCVVDGTTKYLDVTTKANILVDTPVAYELQVKQYNKINEYFFKNTRANNYIGHNNDSGWSHTRDDAGAVLDLTEYKETLILPDLPNSVTTTDENGNEVTKDYTGAKTMAAKIYADYLSTDKKSENYSRRYTTFADTDIYNGNGIAYYLQQTTDIEGDRISTYKTEKKSLPNGVEDFACVVIAGTQAAENSQLINRYIQLVTNTSEDYLTDNDYHKIDVSTCKYQNGRFENIGKDSTSLTFTSGTGFALVQDNADSHTNGDTFTLVDVQFMDPLNKNKIVYHLYVPVYTYRQMTIEFYAAAKTASDSVEYSNKGYTVYSNSYDTLLNDEKSLENVPAHFDAFDSWFTMYLRYRYNPTDINTLLDAGNLNWNYPKYAVFTVSADANAERLPDDTYMVLVDPNGNGDKAYMASISAEGFEKTGTANKETIKFNLSAFSDGSSQFTEKPLRDVVATKLKATFTTETGMYEYIGKTKPDDYATGNYVYTIESGNKVYYQYKSDGSGDYNITATGSVDEDYYINTYVPSGKLAVQDQFDDKGVLTTAGDIVFYTVDIPVNTSLPAPVAGAKAAEITRKRNYEVLIGDLFEQVTDELAVYPENEEINSSRHELRAYTKTSVYLKNTGIGIHLARTSQSIYQSYNIYLDRYDKDGNIENEIFALEDDTTDRFTAYYSTSAIAHDKATGVPSNLDSLTNAYMDEIGENMLNVVTLNGINKTTLGNSTKESPYVIYTYMDMNFNTEQLGDEFPAKQGDAGVKVRVDSLLSYDIKKVSTSNMVKSYPADNHKYYMESLDSAKLTYEAKTGKSELDEYDKTGKNSENYSRLGVNGRTSDENYMPINTVARYNAQSLAASDLNQASAMQLDMKLYKKTDFTDTNGITKVEYVDVTKNTSGGSSGKTIADYLGDEITFTSGGVTKTVKLSELEDKGKITVLIPKEEGSGEWDKNENDIFTTEICFSAKTKTNFTEYANYKVELVVTLLKDVVVKDEEGEPVVDENGNPVKRKEEIELSQADDYLVYTNAKVNHEFLKAS